MTRDPEKLRLKTQPITRALSLNVKECSLIHFITAIGGKFHKIGAMIPMALSLVLAPKPRPPFVFALKRCTKCRAFPGAYQPINSER